MTLSEIAGGPDRTGPVRPPTPEPLPEPRAAAEAARPPRRAEEDAVAASLTQVGLIGRVLVEAQAPRPVGAPPRTDPARGPVEAPRRVERVLKPWGIAMLPDEAAMRARAEAAEAAEEAARAEADAEAARSEADSTEAEAAEAEGRADAPAAPGAAAGEASSDEAEPRGAVAPDAGAEPREAA